VPFLYHTGMETLLEVVFKGFGILLVISCIFCMVIEYRVTQEAKAVCEAKHGKLLKTDAGLVCLKPDVVL